MTDARRHLSPWARQPAAACRRDLACFRNDGHEGDCAYPTADTVPQPAAPAEGLDVERLARALRHLDVLEGYSWDDQCPEGWRHRELATAIAREYAALAQPEDER